MNRDGHANASFGIGGTGTVSNRPSINRPPSEINGRGSSTREFHTLGAESSGSTL